MKLIFFSYVELEPPYLDYQHQTHLITESIEDYDNLIDATKSLHESNTLGSLKLHK